MKLWRVGTRVQIKDIYTLRREGLSGYKLYHPYSTELTGIIKEYSPATFENFGHKVIIQTDVRKDIEIVEREIVGWLSEEQREEVLERAKRDYPPGTRYIGVDKSTSGDTVKVPSGAKPRVFSGPDGTFSIITHVGGGLIYNCGKWAKVRMEEKSGIKSVPEYSFRDPRLLEEARRRYPIGTKYTSADIAGSFGGEVQEVITGDFNWFAKHVQDERIDVTGSDGLIYLNGTWATILERPAHHLESVDVPIIKAERSKATDLSIRTPKKMKLS